MLEGRISLNTKSLILTLMAAAFLVMLLTLPTKVSATGDHEGSITVKKHIDNDGDGQYETTSQETANNLGFRWGLDDEAPTNMMGSAQDDVSIDEHKITEKKVSGFKYTGFFTGPGSCERPESRDYPATVKLYWFLKNRTVTLCNQALPSITVKKQTNPNGDPTNFYVTASTEDGKVYGDSIRVIKDDGSVVYYVAPGTYSVTEDVPAGWTMTSNTCSNLEVGAVNGDIESQTLTTNHVDSMHVTCEIVNTKQTGGQGGGVVQGAQTTKAVQVSAPSGGVGAGVGGAAGGSLAAMAGLSGSLVALGAGLRRFNRN